MFPRLIFLALFSVPVLAQTPQIAPAPNPPHLAPLAFSVGGRVLATPSPDPRFGPRALTFQWPGTYFEAAFSGSAVYFAVRPGHEILHVTVDRQPSVPLADPAVDAYSVTGLADGSHTIRVELVTETAGSPQTFLGFALPRGEKPLAPPHSARQIEFIGDSHTVGYGNTSPTRACTQDQVWATTDTSQAFDPLVAHHYDADYQIDAISGRGVVRNYNGVPANTVPNAYAWTLMSRKQSYADRNWHPQVIVIALGTNDFSTPLHSGEKWPTRDELHADYEATYLHFLEGLRAGNPHAYFVIWATDMADGEIEAEAGKVVDRWKAQGETRVAFLPIDHLTFSACNHHPSLADDRTIAEDLEKDIDAVPGIWSLQP